MALFVSASAGCGRAIQTGAAMRPFVTPSSFIGNEPSRWEALVPTYASVRDRAVYPGIDLVFYGNPTRLDHDFEVAPGADTSAIAWEISGRVSVRILPKSSAVQWNGVSVSQRSEVDMKQIV